MSSVSAVYNPAPPGATSDRQARPVAGKDSESSERKGTASQVEGDSVEISAEARRLLAAEANEEARNETSREVTEEESLSAEDKVEQEPKDPVGHLKDYEPVEPPVPRPLLPPEETPLETAFRLSIPHVENSNPLDVSPAEDSA